MMHVCLDGHPADDRGAPLARAGEDPIALARAERRADDGRLLAFAEAAWYATAAVAETERPAAVYACKRGAPVHARRAAVVAAWDGCSADARRDAAARSARRGGRGAVPRRLDGADALRAIAS